MEIINLKMNNKRISSIPKTYENNFKDLPFENVIRKYRKMKVLDIIKKYPHENFLEIGCGPDPLFNEVKDFDKMFVVEQGKMFYEMANDQAGLNKKIIIINDLIENVADELVKANIDFIVIGGFLHEIENPDEVLQSVKKICSKNTVVFSNVPNAKSFHRLLAYEMGFINSIYEKSEHDKLFQRHEVYDKESFNQLLINNGFKIIEDGSYFIKPFSNGQMDKMLNMQIIENSCLDGLDKMTKILPDMGAELFNCCMISE